MAEKVINSVRVDNQCGTQDYIWIIDPFGSTLKKLDYGGCCVVKSPVIPTWWRDEFEIELEFKKDAIDLFSLSTTISKIQSRDKVFGRKIIRYYYIISSSINNTEKILHSGSTLKSQQCELIGLENLELLKLHLEVIIFASPDDVQSTPTLLKLEDRLIAIKDSEEFLDFSIFVGEEELKVNKAALALASPVFFAMFGHEFTATETQAIHIDDVHIDTVRQFLDFVYTSELPTFTNSTNLKSVVELLQMADKYEVVNLKKLCLEHIYSIFCDEA